MADDRPADRPADAGFSLVELLTVVTIIGILAAIVLPSFLGQRSKAQRATLSSDLRNVSAAQEAFFVEHGTYTVDEVELTRQGFNRSAIVGDLDISVYRVDGAPAYCVAAEQESSGDRAWMSSTTGSISRTNPDPVRCPA